MNDVGIYTVNIARGCYIVTIKTELRNAQVCS